MKRALPILLVLLATGLLAARFGFHLALERTAPGARSPAEITIAKGEGFGSVARRLERDGLIPHTRGAFALGPLEGPRPPTFSPEPYLFEKPLSPLEILDRFREGAIQLAKVTIPEGYRATEIVGVLSEAGLGAADELATLLADPDFVVTLGLPGTGVEGYLYPDTYLFAPGTDPRKVILSTTKRFHEVFDQEMREKAELAGLSVHEVVTLASVVEKETSQAEERRLIASVFLNRLRIGMPLQSDPTVIYGIECFDGNLTRKHIETPGPYNTYTERGLPPGPIASPGREALVAVLESEESNFLYFVSRNDGTHVFTRSLKEHGRAVNRFQRSRSRP